jgi:hypothetical protein
VEKLRKNPGKRPSSLISRLKSVLYFASACFTLLAFNIFGVEVLFHRHIQGRLEQVDAIQESFLETYLADAEFLANSELASESASAFAPKAEQGTVTSLDAGNSLNPLVYWNPNPLQADHKGRSEPLVTPKSRETIIRLGEDWMNGRSAFERGRIQADLDLFKLLHPFRFWDIEHSSPIDYYVSKRKFVLPSTLPVPETLDLISAAKVRLMKGATDGAPHAALREVRKLSMLLLETENFQLVMSGLTALELERRAYREYVDNGWIQAESWKPINQNTTTRAVRAAQATAGYLRALTRPELLQQVISKNRLPPAFCAAVNEQLPLEFAIEDQLTGLWPWERHYRPGYKQLREVAEQAKSVCRIKLFRALDEKRAFYAEDPHAPWPLAKLPYFRTLFALRDWSGWPTHFEAYQRR